MSIENLVLMCLLSLLRKRTGYANNPTPMSGVYVKERYGYLRTPTLVTEILVEGQVWLCEQSCFELCYS